MPPAILSTPEAAEGGWEFEGSTGYRAIKTMFIGSADASTASRNLPQAFSIDILTAGGRIKPHFHRTPQFQVFVGGGGFMGKHRLEPVVVHYADDHTPYGPIVAGDMGLKFFNLRRIHDFGSNYMPESRDLLPTRPGRSDSYQVPKHIVSDFARRVEPVVRWGDVADEDAEGVGVSWFESGPDVTVAVPSKRGGGLYILVLRGSIIRDGTTIPAPSVLFAEGDAPVSAGIAGTHGAAGLALRFPSCYAVYP